MCWRKVGVLPVTLITAQSLMCGVIALSPCERRNLQAHLSAHLSFCHKCVQCMTMQDMRGEHGSALRGSVQVKPSGLMGKLSMVPVARSWAESEGVRTECRAALPGNCEGLGGRPGHRGSILWEGVLRGER